MLNCPTMTEDTSELTPKQRRREVARQIAAELNETEKTPLKTIERLVYVLGEARALSLLAEARQIEAGDGLLTDDGRRRTPGGVFFKLTKDKVDATERRRIFYPPQKAKAQPPDWETLTPLLAEFLAHPQPGEADKMKLTLIGRPGKIVEKETVVMTTLQSAKAPSLPKGLPAPPPKPTTWLVFIAAKQWRKVSQALEADPKDRLIIEGYPAFDARIGGGTMCLYAQSVTTTALQRAKWAEKG
ncbi:MAG: hypothetical protein Kow0031_02620 [Anaerolineae bacterium]